MVKERFNEISGREQYSEKIPENFYDCTYFLIRHGEANYKLNRAIGQSENPEGPVNPREQDFTSDLTEAGREDAIAKAKEFLAHFDPTKDVLYFASSTLVRARETAYIYLEAAKEMGFNTLDTRLPKTEAISGHQQGDAIHEALGENKIRPFEDLALSIDNALVDWIFTPQDLLGAEENNELIAHPENVSSSTRHLWREARAIIEADNKGSWGRNWLAHGEAVKALFENYKKEHSQEEVATITSASDMHKGALARITRIMTKAKEKINNYQVTLQPGQRVRVLAFTHENPLIYFLQQEFEKEGIANLESVAFEVATDKDGKQELYTALENNSTEIKKVESLT